MTQAPAAQHDSKTGFLDTALRVMRTKGYEATTVDDICEGAGLTKGSFFHHFKSKEDLGLSAAAHFAAIAERAFAAAPYRKAKDPLDRLLGYVDFRTSIIRGELPDFTCLLGTMVQETYQTHPLIQKACDRYIREHAVTLENDIAEAKKLYAPRAPWEPQSLALFTQAAIQGAFILAKASGKPDVAVECLSHLRRYVQTQFNPKRRSPHV